jgi:hypothetical protein
MEVGTGMAGHINVVSVVVVIGAYDQEGLCWIWAIPGESDPMSQNTPYPEEHPNAILIAGPCDNKAGSIAFSGLQKLLEKLGVSIVEGYIPSD